MNKKGGTSLKSYMKAGNARNKENAPFVMRFGNAGAVFGGADEETIHPQILKMARKSGQLNLSNKGLNSIPAKVFKINEPDEDELKKLSQNVQIDADDDKWWEHADLSKLYLNSNSLHQIDSLISQLSSLQLLDVSDNSLKEIPAEIGDLKVLNKLVLSHNNLTSLPASIGQLDELRFLSLDHNNLENLPKEFGNLYMLDYLDLSYNQMTTLPCDIGYLQKLSKLVITNNKLQELPPEIGDLFGLCHLDISVNSLTSLPKELGKLPKIREFYAKRNMLSTFPNFETTSIKEIYLGVNRIKKLSNEGFEHLSGLHVLDICENGLEELPDGITYLQNLQRLDLGNNYISNLPYHMGFLQHLKSLTLDGNPLKLIRRDIIQRGTSQLLKYLQGKISQPINTYPGFSDHTDAPAEEEEVVPDQYEMRNCKAMIFNNKKASHIPDQLFDNGSFAKVRVADLSKNMLTEIPLRLSDLSTHLYEMILHHNRLKELPAIIGDMKCLQFLDVQNNLLRSLPIQMKNLSSLREINMAFNKFDHLPECLLNLPSLEIIFAADNKIKDIPVDKMSGLVRLATLDLQNNDIGFVPPELGRMTQLRYVCLDGNSFRVPRKAILAKGTPDLLEYLRSRIIDDPKT